VSSLTPIALSDKLGAAEYRAAPAEGVLRSTARYLLQTEVHTFAFSVAANAILSFFPFLLVLMTLIRYVFHSRIMYDVIESLLRDYIPTGQEFVIRNLNVLVGAHHRAQIFSLVMLLITSTGIFMPLEVALNRIWGFRNNRSYLGNQLMSLGLVFACGSLALLSVGLTAGNVAVVKSALHGYGACQVCPDPFHGRKTCKTHSEIKGHIGAQESRRNHCIFRGMLNGHPCLISNRIHRPPGRGRGERSNLATCCLRVG